MHLFGRLTFVLVIFIAKPIYADCQAAKRLDLVITEIFPDPTPSFGLPLFEFVEIRNISSTAFNLKDWKLGDASGLGTINTNLILYPDSCVIVCPANAASLFSVFGTTIGITNFPSLDNDEDLIVLKSNHGNVIHAIQYTNRWYQNDLKSGGGWSLEMVDPQNACSGENNWTASIDSRGGSPGRANSSTSRNIDDEPPSVLRSFAVDPTMIVVIFTEPVDSISASVARNYFLKNSIGPASRASPIPPLFNEVHLQFAGALVEETVYMLEVTGISDCAGNETLNNNFIKVGRFSRPDISDMVINEVLFDPKQDGFDFVELYNNSNKVIDLRTLQLSNRNSSGNLANSTPLAPSSYAIYPGEYVAFTENKTWLIQHYTIKDDRTIIETTSLPSMPDDAGSVVLTGINGAVIEELHYDTKWHFPLLTDVEGIALERINYRRTGSDKNNWTSAASTAGYATPGYQNSQLMTDVSTQATLSIIPKIFSPDNDGRDDIATISYQLASSGFVCNIIIFDSNGRRVKHLVKNAILAREGYFTWDGLDDNLQLLPVGIYIVFAEMFNLKGKTKKFKTTVALVRPL